MPRKGGSSGNEIFGRKPRLPAVIEDILAFALEDEERGKDMPIPALPQLFARRDAALRLAAEREKLDLEDTFGAVYEEHGLDLAGWLCELPHTLAAAKLVDEALDLLRKLDPAFPGDRLAADVADILAEAGRRDEALAQVDKNLLGADDAWAFARAGDALTMLGEKSRAQVLYRKAQALAEDLEDHREFIGREIPLLEELGRRDEAKALREALELLKEATPEWEEGPEDVEEEPSSGPARAEPEPARNAPCPCGSGKKYKRCCGKA